MLSIIGFLNFDIWRISGKLSASPDPILKAGTPISFKKSAAALEKGVEIYTQSL